MRSILFLALAFASAQAFAGRFVVEAKHPLKLSDLKVSNLKIEKFYPGDIKAFNTRYIVTGNHSIESLKRLSWVKDVEPTYELIKFSLTHPDNARRIVSDELFPFQWGLLNQGQTYYKEKDDIHNLPFTGTPGNDVQWEKLFKTTSKERPVVAVLDSGLDMNHPDIKENLWSNENECGKDPKVDNDNNQLAGDCHGWNFTEAIDSDQAKNPNDIDGHGTHVAGIIAAAQNGEGIVGVAPRALIMPIKVMKDTESKSDVASSDAFARGILYAVSKKVQVINMSLGWPRSLETKYLRDAINIAIDAGIIIVAAAGNNNSVEPLFPCAYEGVVCVAASTLDGTFAGFSNYGSHVDTIAPGEGILSLNPTMYEPEFFPISGYDIKSGTSQASPMVAGLIANAIAQEKGITSNEILARLYLGTKNSDKDKYVMGGNATWDSISTKVAESVIRPVLKRVRQITIRAQVMDAKVIVPVKNYGTLSGPVEVKVESLSAGITLADGVKTFESIPMGSTEDVTVAVTGIDLNREANITLKVTITENGESQSYSNEIPVVRDIRGETGFKKLPFVFLDKPLPVGGVRNGLVAATISTVESFNQTGAHDFFMKRLIKSKIEDESGRLEITIFNRFNNKFVQAPNLVLLENVVSLVNLIRVDLNTDGKEDYFVQTLNLKDGKKYLDYHFYNSEMKPLWDKFPGAKLDLDLSVDSFADVTFINFTHSTLGKILVPAYFSNGQLPKIDQPKNTFQRFDSGKKKRLYYLEPLTDSFRVRTLTTNIWEENLKTELKAKWFATVENENILPASETDKKNGQIRVILSVGLGTKRDIFIATFDGKSAQKSARLPQLVLQTEEIDPVYAVTSNGLETQGEVYFNIYDRTRAKLVTTKDSQQDGQYVYEHDAETDLVAGHLMTFAKDTKKFSVIQTREELIGLTKVGSDVTISKRPKLRYSFLSQKLLAELYSPVTYKRSSDLRPALYVDSTSITLSRIYLFEEQNGKLVSSIRNSLTVPSTCKAMNPQFSKVSGTHEFLFLCLEDKEWMIKTFEMN